MFVYLAPKHPLFSCNKFFSFQQRSKNVKFSLIGCNKGCCCFAHMTTVLNLIIVKKLGGIFLLFSVFPGDKIKKGGQKKCSMNKI